MLRPGGLRRALFGSLLGSYLAACGATAPQPRPASPPPEPTETRWVDAPVTEAFLPAPAFREEPVVKVEAAAEVKEVVAENVKQEAPAAATPAASRPRRRPVFEGTGVLVAPKPIPGKTPAPAYPESARLAGKSGVVVVRVTVSEEGEPLAALVEESSGHAPLDAAAAETALRWRFKPGTWQGKAVELDLLVPFRFNLKTAKKP